MFYVQASFRVRSSKEALLDWSPREHKSLLRILGIKKQPMSVTTGAPNCSCSDAVTLSTDDWLFYLEGGTNSTILSMLGAAQWYSKSASGPYAKKNVWEGADLPIRHCLGPPKAKGPLKCFSYTRYTLSMDTQTFITMI